ncbi:alpha/beta hydrolase [Geobacter sp.]|uniref:alpha/beta hydrolase n=1 Tax=Geobacter sp. TaxID=46610 RepID=UPI002639E414|nr:alpha/beta hydrolase [Geobacter sp.]
MINSAVLPLAQKVVRGNPTMMGMATAATGIIRQMAIKPFTPKKRRREFALRERLSSFHAVRNHIFREKGAGTTPTIVVGGFVPDATEAVEFQRELFRRYGSVYYLNFARNGFSSAMFFAQLADLIEELNRRGERPVIFSISFGCSLVRRFLQTHVHEALAIGGTVFVSPVLCTADLVRPEREKKGGIRMLESSLRRILLAESGNVGDIERQIERARRCFQALFEAGAENRTLSHRHLSIRRKIMEVIRSTPFTGGYQRTLALNDVCFDETVPIFCGPALVMVAEDEESTLVPSSPTLAALRDSTLRGRLFPRGKVRTVASTTSGDPVAHASLIFHHHCYNPVIEGWYDKLVSAVRLAVVS